MKRFLFGFLAVLFLILNTIPYLHIFADDMPTSSQYEMLGAYALSTLITSGEATELDFSDYTENDTSFLIDLGEAIFTGDWSGLAEDGLEWLGETADSVYDSYKEYVSQWKSDHLGIMYSNWFPDETIYVGPDDSYSLARPLRELLTPRGDSSPTPQPDPDYSFYLNYLSSNTWGVSGACSLLNYSINNYSWQTTSISNIYSYCITSGTFMDNSAIYDLRILNPSSINIVSQGSSYFVSYNLSMSPANTVQLPHGNFNYSYKTTINGNTNLCQTVANVNDLPSLTNTFSSMTECLSYLVQHFRYINLTVDSIPWIIVHDSTPTYPIVIPGQLTIYNNQPLEYSFPADTHIELPDLTNIIRNAINSSGVVMWSDIADTYVDVNGQTAVVVTKIVRNDYDNLYMEQYPYPAMLVGMTDQTKFNEHLLDDSHAYLSPMGTVVQETVNVLPPELVSVLAIGAILTIFAVIINRLLE